MKRRVAALWVYAAFVLFSLLVRGDSAPAAAGESITYSAFAWLSLYYDRPPYLRTAIIAALTMLILCIGGQALPR